MMTSSRLSRLSWLAFALIVLAMTAAWAWRVANLPTVDDQRAVVPVSTVWGMHACLIAVLAGLGAVALLVNRRQRRHTIGPACGHGQDDDRECQPCEASESRGCH